jgi:hypothetical protein
LPCCSKMLALTLRGSRCSHGVHVDQILDNEAPITLLLTFTPHIKFCQAYSDRPH